MENLDLLGFLIVTLNCNVTVVGKIWLTFMVLLRMAVVVLAGYPIYQDEQERFVCNTLQPGCANVCYDIFSPVSHLRFWLAQSVSVFFPYAVFSVYVLHKGAHLAALGAGWSDGGPGGHHISHPSSGLGPCREGCKMNVPDFSCSYIIHLCLRTLVEAAFGALHYLLFGFLVPKQFSCTQSPCSSVVDCYVSRPTEKSIMMLFIWAVSMLSFLLSIADLICSVWRRTSRRPGPGVGPESSFIMKECGGGTFPPGHTKGHKTVQSQSRRLGEVDEDGGWEEEGAPSFAGRWKGEQRVNSPSGKSSVSAQVELQGEDDSEGMPSANDKLPMAYKEHDGRSHKAATQEERSRSFAGPEGQPSASQSYLAGHYSSSLPHPPDRLATSSSVPHLRTKKSEWV
ncbi:gap junction delta-4 protein [Ctenodactylus gundi]